MSSDTSSFETGSLGTGPAESELSSPEMAEHFFASHQHCNRRHFIKASGGAAAGLAAYAMLPSAAHAQPTKAGAGAGRGPRRGSGVPKPVAGYSPLLKADTGGLQIPFFLPVEVDPFGGYPAGPPQDPSLIDDFRGVVAMVEASGVTTNNSDGVPQLWACDIRTMKGTFRDRAGRRQPGAFAFL